MAPLLNHKKMKLRGILFSVLVTIIISSCDYNVNDSPGPQMSSSVKEAQNHGTYICTYMLKGNTINKIGVQTIFAERKFWRESGLFLTKKIDCCASQLVIVSNQPFSAGSVGYNKNWMISGFDNIHSFTIYKDYKGVIMPDTIPLTVLAINGQDSTKVIEKFTLYKVIK